MKDNIIKLFPADVLEYIDIMIINKNNLTCPATFSFYCDNRDNLEYFKCKKPHVLTIKVNENATEDEVLLMVKKFVKFHGDKIIEYTFDMSYIGMIELYIGITRSDFYDYYKKFRTITGGIHLDNLIKKSKYFSRINHNKIEVRLKREIKKYLFQYRMDSCEFDQVLNTFNAHDIDLNLNSWEDKINW